MTPLLEVHDLTTRFEMQDSTIYAVNGISYTVNKGEILGLVGESGSGKSVSVMSLLRLIPMPPGKIVSGAACLEGRDLLRISYGDLLRIRGNEAAVIFQDPMTSFNPVMTIGDQIAEPMILHQGLTARQARSRTIELLDLVGIPSPDQRVEQYPHQFSGGMRQRAMIAMALGCEPKLLIADEPTTALDVTIQAQITDIVRQLQREFGMSLIWISHDLGVVAGLADRVAVMYAGFIVEEAAAEELYGAPQHPYTHGLLASLPSLETEEISSRLSSIKGLPPYMDHLPEGCPFYPRCPHHLEQCRTANPPLAEACPGRKVRCWNPVGGGGAQPDAE
jgi:oligopeptide transport system ATP-binding protein